MSYDNDGDGGLTELERQAAVWGIIYGGAGGYTSSSRFCECDHLGECTYCKNQERKNKLELSARFREGAKAVAGLDSNREIKNALIKGVHKESLDHAIISYMVAEDLPYYYASIVRSPNCLDSLIKGIFFKVCGLQANPILVAKIKELEATLQANPERLIPYDRVGRMQQFIFQTVNLYMGPNSDRAIPTDPMKNGLSAARLHLSIFDVTDHHPSYVVHMDTMSTAATFLEYDDPRPFIVSPGKTLRRRWRVRHLRPLSYYFTLKHRELINRLAGVSEGMSTPDFLREILQVYADV